MIELLVVIGIIGILAAILLTAIFRAKTEARITNCMSNLRQLSIALETYRTNFNDKFPTWLTYLCPTYTAGNAEVFRCPMDLSEGVQGGRPDWFPMEYGQFPNADKDGPKRSVPNLTLSGPSSEDWFPCSYLFEFCGEECDWYAPPDDDERDFFDTNRDGIVSWYERKYKDVIGGSWISGGSKHVWEAYGQRVPVIRCFWHADQKDALNDYDRILNITYNYRIYEGKPQWEND
jgi:type II secretory pathway pseudopilin PulG